MEIDGHDEVTGEEIDWENDADHENDGVKNGN